MRIVVVVPSPDYKANAGARIRYGRMIDEFAVRGVGFTMEPLAGFDPARAACDVVIFSKCHDARAVVCAHILSQRGIRVGVDIFDDYFSQQGDSRLNRLRSWLTQVLAPCAFALASTPATAELLRAYSPDLPVHILNDPAPAFDAGELTERLRNKRSEVLASGRLRVAWFGMGDNPQFALGIRDVAAFAEALAALAQGRFAVELSILTNRRSLDAAGLERITTLPVETTVEIWTEEREAALLQDATVAFLPVNANRFSRAKSLNRAVTALAAGCQLLSAGFPLYAPLEPLIYRDADQILAHLDQGSFRLSSATIGLMEDKFVELASVEHEIDRFQDFLGHVGAPPIQAANTVFLIHGSSSNAAAHNLVQSVGGVSVASPFCTAPFAFDAIVETQSTGALDLFVSRSAWSRLVSGARRPAKSVRIRGHKYWQVTPAATHSRSEFHPCETLLPLQLNLYPTVLNGVRQLLEQYFAAERIVTSELSALPFDQSGFAHA